MPWSSASIFDTKGMTAIHSLKCTVFILTGKLEVIHCFCNCFSSSMFISKKKLDLAMRSFKCATIISIEYSQPSIISTVLHIFLTLKFAFIQFYQHTFCRCISNTSHRETNFLLKQLYFLRSIDYTEMKTATWSNYFFLITSIWSQILFLISFFLKIISFPAQLLFQEASRSPKLEFLKKIPPSKLYFLSMLRRSHDWL